MNVGSQHQCVIKCHTYILQALTNKLVLLKKKKKAIQAMQFDGKWILIPKHQYDKEFASQYGNTQERSDNILLLYDQRHLVDF